METVLSWMKYLKDPLLVAKFQKRFGVDIDLREGLVAANGPNCMCAQFIDWNWKDASDDGQKRAIRSRKTCTCQNTGRGDVTSEWVTHGRDSSKCVEDEPEPATSEDSSADKYVTNKFWYYLFVFGTSLGDEMFYAVFFSFWFWNVDGAVGRRVALVWALVMYIGQGLKDIIKWPRPAAPPVLRLEKKWELEYGMPSTHAMTGAAVPFSAVIFTAYRYEYPLFGVVLVAMLWCSLVCTSRIYLGMHSFLDIVAGLLLVPLLFTWVIPLVDILDPILLKDSGGAFYLLTGALILAVCSPGGDRWTPARGDTIVILGSVVGLLTGAWINYQTGIISSNGPPIDPPFPIIWPSWKMIGLSVLRMILGLLMILVTRIVMKATTRAVFSSLKTTKSNSTISVHTKPSSMDVFVELSQKFVTYFCMGTTVVFGAPFVFRMLGIERPTFHTEV